jgi:hypothetical protein
MKLILALVLAAALSAACSLGESEMTAYPLPSVAITIELPTQPPAASGQGCATPALSPVLIHWDSTHRVVSFGGEKVYWPYGYSARMLPTGRLEILAPDGKVIARDGDTVQFVGPDYLHVCGIV